MMFYQAILAVSLALYPAQMWCGCCGDLFQEIGEAPEKSIVCEEHGIAGYVCESCAEWHD